MILANHDVSAVRNPRLRESGRGANLMWYLSRLCMACRRNGAYGSQQRRGPKRGASIGSSPHTSIDHGPTAIMTLDDDVSRGF
jgi:hypothetical protein